MKNKEELKSCFEGDKLYLGGYVKNKIDQLDEPETLSPEWIENERWQAYDPDGRTLYWVVSESDLEDVLVPEKELPVIPQSVADWIESRDYYNVYKALQDLSASGSPHASKDVRNWIFRNEENAEKFVRAWLDGYTVEEEEKYYLKLGNLYLAEPLGDMTSDTVRMTRDKEVAYQFTDEKSIAAHLDKFKGIEAVKTEEAGE